MSLDDEGTTVVFFITYELAHPISTHGSRQSIDIKLAFTIHVSCTFYQ